MSRAPHYREETTRSRHKSQMLPKGDIASLQAHLYMWNVIHYLISLQTGQFVNRKHGGNIHLDIFITTTSENIVQVPPKYMRKTKTGDEDTQVICFGVSP